VLIAGFSLVLVSLHAGPAAGAVDPTLAVLSWDRPAATALAPFRGEGDLLAHGEDFAVLALAAGATPTGGLVEVGPLRAGGSYFLFLTARWRCFTGRGTPSCFGPRTMSRD
jgi:hypothetical protein